MKKIDKPIFKFSLLNTISITVGIISFILSYIYLTWYLALIILLIIILITIVYNIYKYIKQVNTLYSQYLTIFNNHTELAKLFEKKGTNLIELNKLLNEYKYILNNVLAYIEQGIIPVNEYETKYLENLLKVFYQQQ